jgi:hypothetical protein
MGSARLTTCDKCAVELYESEVEFCRRCGGDFCEECLKDHPCKGVTA